MTSSHSIWETCIQHQDTSDRLKKTGAAASAASSPGRRAPTSPPVPNPWDVFTYQGKPHRVMRMLPGDFPGEPIQPHQAVTATIYTLNGTLQTQARATARTQHLVHVILEDDLGETYGTWLPKLSVQFNEAPPTTNNRT